MVLLAAGCGAPDRSGAGEDARGAAVPVTPQLRSDLAVVRRHRVLFAHHSVGQNVVEGLARADAAAGGDGALRLVSIEQATSLDGPLLAHGGGGRNGDPRSKIDFFVRTVDGAGSSGPDLAFMKLCFVDFEPRTDVPTLFAYYQQAMDRLERDHPEIRFGHVTVPLVRRPTDLRSTVRRVLGLEVWEDAANARRSEFNRLLAGYRPGAPLFDLAGVESVGPDGARQNLGGAGPEHPSLHPAYTDDGGHLNEAGRRVAAAAAARFMAGALSPRPAVP